jgi:hypothetical protein
LIPQGRLQGARGDFAAADELVYLEQLDAVVVLCGEVAARPLLP